LQQCYQQLKDLVPTICIFVRLGRRNIIKSSKSRNRNLVTISKRGKKRTGQC